MITDCHIHIQPLELFKPAALELMKQKRAHFEQIAEFARCPAAFLKHLDAAGVDRAVLINYVAPEVIGFTNEVNSFVATYCKENPRRLIDPLRQPASAAHAERARRCRAGPAPRHPPHQNPPAAPVVLSERLSRGRDRTGNHLSRR